LRPTRIGGEVWRQYGICMARFAMNGAEIVGIENEDGVVANKTER